MTTALWVAFGGALGSLARYGVAGALNSNRHPWGTVAVNVVGSLVLGLLIGIWGFEDPSARRIGVTVGLLGGFTTFSTFALDFVKIWEDGQPTIALLMVAVSIAGGLAAAVAGLTAGRTLAG